MSSRAFKVQFSLDNDQLEAFKDELIEAKRLAVDERRRVLVWVGAAHLAEPLTTRTALATPQLLRRWEQSKAGLGQVVLLSGEAGIGKTALVEALRAHVAREGYTRVGFRSSPYHTYSALYPVIEHMRRVLRLDRQDSPETVLDKLERALQGLASPKKKLSHYWRPCSQCRCQRAAIQP